MLPETPGNGYFYVTTGLEGWLLLDESRSIGLDHTGYGLSIDFSDKTVGVNLTGGDLGDIIRSGSNNDILRGGAGNDILEGGAGSDTLTGGDGIDTVSFEHSTVGVQIVLLGQTDGYAAAGDGNGDTWTQIENARGGSGSDVITGSVDAGRNVMEGGAGSDILIGDGSLDVASYVHSMAGVTVDLSAGTGSGGDAEGDSLSSISDLRGSLHDDSLTGDGLANTLDGMGSDGPLGDSLSGLGGNDRLIVRDAPAMVDGGADFDTVVIATGASVTFGAGSLVNVEAMSVLAGASVDLSALGATPGTISSSADATIVATNTDDRIVLSAGIHTVTGGGGVDTMYAGTGADTFVFEAGFGRDRVYRIDTASDHLDLYGLGLTIDDIMVGTTANGLDTVIHASGDIADWIVLKGVILDKATMPDGFLIL